VARLKTTPNAAVGGDGNGGFLHAAAAERRHEEWKLHGKAKVTNSIMKSKLQSCSGPSRRAAVAAIVVTAAALGHLGAGESADPAIQQAVTAATTERLREGTRIHDQEGRFKATGDRLTFYAVDAGRRFLCLENLALERIARAVHDNPEALDWRVTATATEYQGANYLLVTHATQLARSATADGTR
jgi:hypothetical protein